LSARPGSAPWLLRHELRLFWYTALSSPKPGEPRGFHWKLVAVLLVLWLLLHLGAYVVLRKVASGHGPVPQELVVAASAVLLATFLYMLSSALKSSVQVLFDRGDMDLLLSSPLPSRSIFTVRLAGIVIGVSAIYLFFLTPLAHAGALLGQWRWLAAYPVLLGIAALAASAAMLLTLGLVRWLGARRTRVVAQVLGAIAGALLFVLSQLPNMLGMGQPRQDRTLASFLGSGGGIDAESLVWLPGRAALGDPLAVAVMTVLALLAFGATVALTHRSFTRGLQLAASSGRTPRRPAGALRFRFGGSVFSVVVRKEWRLILRDPQLISQVLLNLLYLLPICFLVFKEDGARPSAIGAGLTMLSGSLCSALAWIVLQAEDAPDLIQSAPLSAGTVRNAKLFAAIAPVLALVGLPVLWLAWSRPVVGGLAAFTICGISLGAALIVMWAGKPGSRDKFNSRGQRNGMAIILELSHLLGWGTLALLLPLAAGMAQVRAGMMLGIAAAATVALAMPGLAYLLRHRAR
jgi:ABC-2 type transport system permease protein